MEERLGLEQDQRDAVEGEIHLEEHEEAVEAVGEGPGVARPLVHQSVARDEVCVRLSVVHLEIMKQPL